MVVADPVGGHTVGEVNPSTPQPVARRRAGLPFSLRLVVLAGVALVGLHVMSLVVAQPLSTLSFVPLAFVPAVVVAMIRWSDPFQVSQDHLFPWALLTGAGVVAMTALVMNSVVAVLAGELTVVVLGAPVLEELLKATAVLAVLRFGSIGPVTLHAGAAVGALIGSVFAFTEDLSYALASEDPFVQTVFRLLFGPFFHATTGALFGVAYAWGTTSAFAAAVASSVALHVVWNTMAQLAVSLPVALTFSTLLTILFTASWSYSGWSQRRRVIEGDCAWMLPLERELLVRPTLANELAQRRPGVLDPDDLKQWKRSVLHVTEADRADTDVQHSRLAALVELRGSLHQVLSARCDERCARHFPNLAHHHFLDVHHSTTGGQEPPGGANSSQPSSTGTGTGDRYIRDEGQDEGSGTQP
jgi:RsiW-degrading membrane proteinase PrsW (M82 family)